jgi:hypothetical protein
MEEVRGRVAFFRMIAPGACFMGMHHAYAMAEGMLGSWNLVEAASIVLLTFVLADEFRAADETVHIVVADQFSAPDRDAIQGSMSKE